MSNVTKYYCDRCNKEIRNSNAPTGFGLYYQMYDMCEECKKLFDEFMKEAKNEKSN